MAQVTRGFGGRRRPSNERLPPGQYLEQGFPVLSAGPTPRIRTKDWTFSLIDRSGRTQWSWQEFLALPSEKIDTDIHCVTRWSKLDTHWRGVSIDTLFGDREVTDHFTMVHCHGGYTTNVPLADLLGGKAWIAYEYDNGPLPAEHGGPARLLVPHLYFWKSAKWVRSMVVLPRDEPGFWERNGYHLRGDPWLEERYS